MEHDLSPEGGRSSRRDRIMGKLFKPKDRKMTSQESANEISDFLGHSDRLQVTHPTPRPPPFQNTGPPSLAIDTSKASRFTKAANYEGTSQQNLPFRTQSHSPPRLRKKKGLNVRFADTYPDVMGEGGDECEAPVAEIGKRKRARPPPANPGPPTHQGSQYRRQGSTAKENTKGNDDFVPAPIRRTQTGFSSIERSSSRASPSHQSSEQPRAIPAGESAPSRFLDTDHRGAEDRRSYIETHQQEQRRAEGMALAEAMRSANNSAHPDWDDHVSSPESNYGSPPQRRQENSAGPSPPHKEPPSPVPSDKPSRSPIPPSLAESVSSMLRTQSTRSPLTPPERNPARKSPRPPQDSSQPGSAKSPLPPIRTEPLPDFSSKPSEPQRRSPDELRINTDYSNESPPSAYLNSTHSTSDLSFKATPITQNPASRAFASSSIERTKSLHDVVVAAGDDAFETFSDRTKHLYELFRLYAEQQKPLDTARPEDVSRGAVWWFLKGRTSLENVIRNRPKDPDDTRHLIARYQAYTDLAKGHWLTEVALPEIAEGKYSPVGGELGEVRQALQSNLRKLAISMKRNGFLPPDEPFLPQTMDKSIWVEYPSLSQDVIALLNGKWGSMLTVQQPTRSMDSLEALPIGDTSKHFMYTRVAVDVYLMEQGIESAQTYLPCMLSVVRSPEEPGLNFIVASQNGSVFLRIQSDKKAGPSWHSVKWRPEAHSIEIKLPRGFVVAVQCTQQDFKVLWGIFDFSTKVQGYLYPRQDEVIACSMTLRGFHYFDANPQGRVFPKEAVGQCQLALFERVLKENSPTGPRTFHRGFRLAVVTGSRIRTLSGVSHAFAPQLPVQFAMLRGEQRAPLLQLEFNDGKDRGRMVMSFGDEQEREKVLRLISGSYVHHDEEVVAEMPLEGMNISEGLADIKGGFAATQRLPWQRARIVNDRYAGEEPQTVLAEKLRIEIDSVDKTGVGIVSTITDRVNVAPGELKMRLGTKDILTLQVFRQPQLDMTVSLLETGVPKESSREFAHLQKSIQSPTVRTYRFPSFKDLHAFQLGLTGYSVLFDGVAASLNISRRMMVVPIHKKWEAGTTRIQVVQQDRTVQLLAFFEDWHHGQCMGFVLKGTDVFECFSRNGKAGLKLADAKFPLPKVPADGSSKTDDMAFLCLDMPDFAGEHDDITILFEDGLERDRLCTVLPAPVKGSRLSKVK
ncbi:hypothetical protein SAMD00023353_6900060 [Rosellinia necatrix]|uniref:Uncharacterized protein n=1 Tax=Rosellinia necatrix TaxID=77044 RepID=A0A1W2TSX8_ROSNE|nr:hypothetical protein SAMD00023353_6900060 [Rosellinia necatrix]